LTQITLTTAFRNSCEYNNSHFT